MTDKRRVVVTGIGAVTPLAPNAEDSWKKIINSESGIRNISLFDTTDSACKIAGEVIFGEGKGEFNLNEYVDIKEQKKMDRFIQFAVAASDQAIRDSGWVPKSDEEKYRTGVMTGSGIGGLPMIEKTSITMKEKGIKRISPFFIPSSLIIGCFIKIPMVVRCGVFILGHVKLA